MYENENAQAERNYPKADHRYQGDQCAKAAVGNQLNAGAGIIGGPPRQFARVNTPVERQATIVSPNFLPTGELIRNRFANSCGTIMEANRFQAFDGGEYQVNIYGGGNTAQGLRELAAELCSLADHLDGCVSAVVVGERTPHAPKQRNSVVRKAKRAPAPKVVAPKPVVKKAAKKKGK